MTYSSILDTQLSRLSTEKLVRNAIFCLRGGPSTSSSDDGHSLSKSSSMATDLQRQVAALQSQRVSTATTVSGKASLFLSKKEAGNVDTSAVWEAAVKGLKVLTQYDDRFSWCLDTLLHSSSVDFQRELKTKEVSQVVFRCVAFS